MSNFVIDDDSKCNWALKKIAKLEKEMQEKSNIAEEEIFKINEWLTSEIEKRENHIEHLQSLIREYTDKLKEDDPDLKTHSLPYGEIKYRSQQPKWVYKKSLTDYVKQTMPELIKVKETVNKAELKKICNVVNGKVVNKETGEIIKGVEVEERGENFFINARPSNIEKEDYELKEEG